MCLVSLLHRRAELVAKPEPSPFMMRGVAKCQAPNHCALHLSQMALRIFKLRVSLANRLYMLLHHVRVFCHQRGMLICVENPRSSLFWLTDAWKKLPFRLQFTAHQACAYGGRRPKWTVLAHNVPCISKIRKECPGQSPSHVRLGIDLEAWQTGICHEGGSRIPYALGT